MAKTMKRLPAGFVESEVTTPETYEHFKSLVPTSPNLCKGPNYKVHIATHKDFPTLIKNHHHRIIYIHDNREIKAYIAVKHYAKDGGYLFIHKLCSSQAGLGSYLMNKILNYAQKNHKKLGITYLSLTTHNLELVGYYSRFKPTFIHNVKRPGSKAKNPATVAYMIWQLSDEMPIYSYA